MSISLSRGDISEELRRSVQSVVSMVLSEHKDNQDDMARVLKQRLESSLSSGWQVIVGRNFSCQVIHEKGTFAHYTFGPYAVVMWRSGI